MVMPKLCTSHYDCTWFPRDTHCMDILGSDGNHSSDLLSPSALPSTSCTDDYERDNSILNTTSLTWWSIETQSAFTVPLGLGIRANMDIVA